MSKTDHNKIEDRLEEELSSGISSVSVMVRKKDVEKAKEIIEEEGGDIKSTYEVEVGRDLWINYE